MIEEHPFQRTLTEAELEALRRESERAQGKYYVRVTPEDVDRHIKYTAYYQFPGTRLIVCCITMTNGFNVVGYSAPAHEGNFDPEIGSRLAFTKARDQIWPLLGYMLRDSVHKADEALAVSAAKAGAGA